MQIYGSNLIKTWWGSSDFLLQRFLIHCRFSNLMHQLFFLLQSPTSYSNLQNDIVSSSSPLVNKHWILWQTKLALLEALPFAFDVETPLLCYLVDKCLCVWSLFAVGYLTTLNFLILKDVMILSQSKLFWIMSYCHTWSSHNFLKSYQSYHHLTVVDGGLCLWILLSEELLATLG